MATEATGVTGGSSGYNYSYTKPIEAEQRVKQEVKDTPKAESTNSLAQKPTENNKRTEDSKQASEVKSLYETQQEEVKRQQEEVKRQQDQEEEAKYLKDLTDKLNAKMNSFSENIKFGVNDKTNSIIVSVIEQNNEKKIKELSSEDASKLFRRLDYVLGVIFDNKG